MLALGQYGVPKAGKQKLAPIWRGVRYRLHGVVELIEIVRFKPDGNWGLVFPVWGNWIGCHTKIYPDATALQRGWKKASRLARGGN